MKRPATTIALLLVALYFVWCLRAFWTRPPLDFVNLSTADQQAVSTWYHSTSRMSRQPWSAKAILHAIRHPFAPHQFRPSVIEGGLGGEGSVTLSYGGTVAIFAPTGINGALEFQRLETAK